VQTQRGSGRWAGAEERSVGCFSTDERTVDSGHDADANVTRARRDGGPTPPPASPSQLQLSLVSASSPAQPRSISRFPLIRGDRLNPSHRWPKRPLARPPARPPARPVRLVPVPRERRRRARPAGRPASSGRRRRRPSCPLIPSTASVSRVSASMKLSVAAEAAAAARDATRGYIRICSYVRRKHTTSRRDLSSSRARRHLTADECNSRLSVQLPAATPARTAAGLYLRTNSLACYRANNDGDVFHFRVFIRCSV